MHIPRERTLDSTLALGRDPYHFIAKRCRAHGADLFATRLMLQRTICMTGAAAAELFYGCDRLVRQGAAPGRVQRTLFGKGGVQGLDGDAHRHRKHLFLTVMAPARVAELLRASADAWTTYSQKWAVMPEVVLYDEACELLTTAVCAWAGVPLHPSEVRTRTRQLSALSTRPAASARATGGHASPAAGPIAGSRA